MIFRALKLQWGRSDEGAETQSWPVISGSSTKCFNGAAPMKERKRTTSLSCCASCWCFNGAAPMKERKLDSDLYSSTLLGALQWGRSDEGAET